MTIKEQAIKWVQEYFAANGSANTKAVVGISGGKDSSVVASLCCAALGKERVVGVMMPNGVQPDIEDSKKLCDFLGIEHYTINIQKAFEGITQEILLQTKPAAFNNQYKTNMPSRLRMSVLYGIAALNGNARVSCNGNLSERIAGYFTLWGDGAGDFAPLAYLFVDEVVQLGLDLGLPEYLCVKAPADGMSGKTDEDNLGFSYDDLKKVCLGNIESIEKETVEKIQNRIRSLSFKRKLLNLPCFVPKGRELIR